MGHRSQMKTPRFVNGYIDRHGKARWYFRRAGLKKVPLPGLPWSPEFMAAYEAAKAGQAIEIGSKRTKPGSLRALAVSYFNSIAFRSMAVSQWLGPPLTNLWMSDKIPFGLSLNVEIVTKAGFRVWQAAR